MCENILHIKYFIHSRLITNIVVSQIILQIKSMLICTFGHWKSKNNKFLQSSRITPLFKQLCEKLVLLERIILWTPMYMCVLHDLLYASIPANAMLHQLLSVSFWVITKCLNSFGEALLASLKHKCFPLP